MKKTPTPKQLPAEPTDTIEAVRPALRTVWNTRCGGHPGGEWLSIAAAGGKSAAEPGRKPARVRAKAA